MLFWKNAVRPGKTVDLPGVLVAPDQEHQQVFSVQIFGAMNERSSV